MGFKISNNIDASKFILIIGIGVLVIVGLTLNFIAQEPVNKSLVIKLETLDGSDSAEGFVTEDGFGEQLKYIYTLNILNKDSSGGRNVTFKYNWTTELPNWNVTFNPEYVIVGSNDIQQIEVIVEAPMGVSFGQKTVFKVFAWEYLDIAEPTIDKWNTTKDVDNGEVTLTTKVEKATGILVNPQPGSSIRLTCQAGEQQNFQGKVTWIGTEPGRAELSSEVSINTRATLWPNAISFYPSDLSPILKYGQEWLFRIDVDVPSDAEAGIYFIEVTATAKTFSDTYIYTIDVPEPDLYIDELFFSHLSILKDSKMTITVKIGNIGSKVIEEFGVEVSAKNPDGGWEAIGLENITGLDYGKIKVVTFNYKVKTPGLLIIRARVDPNNDIAEKDNANNILEDNIEVVDIVSVTPSFYVHFLIILCSISTVSILSWKSRKMKKNKQLRISGKGGK